jgi:hypothetical protein
MMATAELVVPEKHRMLENVASGYPRRCDGGKLTKIDTDDGTLDLSICRLIASEDRCEGFAEDR